MVTEEYFPQHERYIDWCDSEIGVNWQIKENIIVSEKDRNCPSLKNT
jgi:dTDP-4-dehydrorhamnose 3,5-epimerase